MQKKSLIKSRAAAKKALLATKKGKLAKGGVASTGSLGIAAAAPGSSLGTAAAAPGNRLGTAAAAPGSQLGSNTGLGSVAGTAGSVIK